MNKVKMFFIAAALVLTTAGVFAGKAKFSVTGTLYATDGTTYYQLSQSGNLPSLQIGLSAPNVQATITSSTSGNPALGLYSYNAGAYTPVYTQGF